MSEYKKEWKVVDGYYPGFLNIVGASYTVSIVTSATDLTIEDYVNRTNDAHLMAAAPDLLEALEAILPFIPRTSASEGGASKYSENVKAADMVRAAINKARGQQ